ncbi:MAG: tRNA (adenosine(37)-N6)-threonylcarbamoyltransferase complex transferase subunit TsaD [Endomicrobium sp.]|jgi:N6-L-threonylcarbamoyladenine synthase|nr:tRNA (adenosine(37)-N6)-threonylcarbamoyltransferase complex transferase subunit TsaD [Endomicrobium sp.]
MNILALETSCDETSASVILNGAKVKSLVISSQIKIHAKYFGVVPEVASRAHLENINPVIVETLKKSEISFSDFSKKIDAIAVTAGPGLAGALLVGIIAAKTMASIYKKPLIPVNHLEGHLYSAFIGNKSIKPPFLSLIISGGHTEIMIVEDFGKYKILGGTRDDAVGEAFDKAAKMLGLEYPGGPIIDKRAEKGNPATVNFTRPYLKGSWDFSFSGIKTALLNYLKNNSIKTEQHLNDICASFRQAIAETLCFKAFEGAKKFNLKQIVLGGGVSANSLIRSMFMQEGKKNKIKIFIPSFIYCTDNAAIIGYAAYLKQKKCGLNYNNIQLKPNPSLSLVNW